MPSATGLAYALIVVQGVLLLFSVLQVVQSGFALRRDKKGQATAPQSWLILVATAAVALTLSYAFDISVTALTLVQGSQTPPPSGAHLALVVCTIFLGQGLAPAMVFAAGASIIDSRVETFNVEHINASTAKRRKLAKGTEIFCLFALPILMASYLGVFSKAVLDTPSPATVYHRYISIANYLYRAAIITNVLLFRRLASRAISFHLRSKELSFKDPIMRTSMLYHLTPAMFARTIAIFVFTPLASSFASPKTPASATAILLAFNIFVGVSIALAVQSLLGAAMRPAAEWSPTKTPTEREIETNDLPGDNAPPPSKEPGNKHRHKRSESIVLSPTRGSFGSSPTAEGNATNVAK